MKYASRMVVVCCLAGSTAHAQVYPAKPVRLINCYSAGGSIDIVARPLAHRLSEALGQNFIVENRPGAGGNIGGDVAAKAAADGYTVLIASTAQLTINPHIYRTMPFDPMKDLVPVALLTQAPTALVVHPALPVASVKDLVALAKTRPEQLTYASAGNGGINHLTTEMFMMKTGVKLTHVPYKGGAPAFQDVVGGQVHLMMPSASTMMPLAKLGRVKVLAVNSSRRLAELPAVPTMQEAGLAGFESNAGIGLLVPAGTPGAIVSRLQAEAVRIIQAPDIRALLSKQGVEVIGAPADAFAKMLQEESARWASVVKAGKVEPQ